jgi:hypothetical protein
MKLKRNWNVSVAALAHRMHGLNLITEWHYRTICIEIAQRGYRSNEPDSIPRESSQLLHKVFQALRNEGISASDIAEQLHIDSAELNSLVFGLVITLLQGGRTGATTDTYQGRGRLREV